MSIRHALSVRSDHSLGESIMQIDSIVARAKELGYESVALVDTMSVSGLVPFNNKCKKEGIKPIIGCVVRVVDDPTYRKPSKESGEKEKKNPGFNLKVYVKTDAGLRGLMKLLTKGNSLDYFYYVSRVGLSDVLDLEDVVVTTGDLFNLYHHPRASEITKKLQDRFGDDFFIELVPIHTPLFDTLNHKALSIGSELKAQLVASYPTFYYTPEDADSLDVLRAITSNNNMGSRSLPIPYVRDMAFSEASDLVKRSVEMGRRIGHDVDLKSVFTNMQRIVDACTYEFEKLPPSLPKMAPNEFLALVEECKKGWAARFAIEVMGHKPDNLPVYKERLAYELNVIRNLGFANYFLVVQDIVKWSKSNDITVGPGRGSVGGSLIAYLMGITDVDPIRFDLLFERFINPDRLDLPDADLDFMSSRRHEVIKYVMDRYGKENVAGISNFATLGTASSIRDVGRVHGLTPLDYACSKQVEKEHGVSLSLEESAKAVPDIQKFSEQHPVVWKHATKLEGCMRNLGQHAAGVIVAGEPIANRAVLKRPTEADGLPIVYWDKQVVEDWGLIKMDILGLSTLDILNIANQYIGARHGKTINWLSIPLDDPEVMAAFGKGKTVGVFQFEGSGMQKLLRDLAASNPLNFEDISAATALYRPGPIDAGLVDQFVAIKQGMKAIEYDHPLMENALKNTYGVITYQEQVMQVCRDLAGFTMTEADHVRKAMGKKDKEKMALYREKFIAGAVASGMGEYDAMALWDKIEGFAGYAFNKSHSVEYSVISYWAMWLKVNFTAEFYAAALTVMNDKEDKVTALVTDAKAQGLKILPPDINISSDRIEIKGDKELYAPFQAVKGISTNVTRHILDVREAHGKPFESKIDFEAAVALAGKNGKINKNHRERLDLVGAFASIEPGTPPAMDESRLKDRIEYMPGLTVELVKATRGITMTRAAELQIMAISGELKTCDKCSLKGQQHPDPRFGTKPKFMMVFDTPNFAEAKAGAMLEGDVGKVVKAALKDAGVSPNFGYYTALVKAPKEKGAKTLSNEQINGCVDYLKREIDVLKPPVIVAMGAAAARFFVPSLKGGPADYAGKVIFDPSLDASIVLGANPASVHFDASKIKLLQDACATLAKLLED